MVVNRAKADGFMLRLPDGMRERIKAAGETNQRSMNAEIVATLEEKYPAPSPIFVSFPDTPLKICILHWLPEINDWQYIDYYVWAAFRATAWGSGDAAMSLPNVDPGINYFMVAIADTDDTLFNLVIHKYEILKSGAVKPRVYEGLSGKEIREYGRLSELASLTDAEDNQLHFLLEKMFVAQLPPHESIEPLKRKLPAPVPGSAAEGFLKRFEE